MKEDKKEEARVVNNAAKVEARKGIDATKRRETNRSARREARGDRTREEISEDRTHNCISRRVARCQERHGKLKQRLTFETLEFPSDGKDHLYHFESDPEASAILYHINSGGNKFRTTETILGNARIEERGDLTTEEIEMIAADINQDVLTEDEVTELLERYLSYQGREVEGTISSIDGLPDSKDAHILACGMCGIASVNGRYGKRCTTTPLSELPHCIALNESERATYVQSKNDSSLKLPVDDKGNEATFDVYKLKSCYESKILHKTYHIHPEFVHMTVGDKYSGAGKVECTTLCHACSAWALASKREAGTSKPPENSIAAGLDFGDPRRLGLADPTVPELILIAKARHFHNVIKVQSNHEVQGRSDYTKNKLRAGNIAFRQDAPIIAAIALAYQDIWERFRKSLTIELVGPEGKQEKLARRAKMQTLLQGRAYVVYQWLAVLQSVHLGYKNDPKLGTSDFAQFSRDLKSCCEKLIDDAVRVTDESSLRTETMVGEDVSQVRTKIITRAESKQLKKMSQSKETQTQMAMSYALVANTSDMLNEVTFGTEEISEGARERVKQRLDKQCEKRFEELKQIAEAFNVDLPEPPTAGDNTNEDEPHRWKSERDAEPLNEFEEMQELLVSAFPTVFMFGITYKNDSLMNPKQMEHLLLQYTNSAATNRELLFYLFDCQSRHKILHNLSAKIKKDPEAFKEYSKLVRDDEFQEKIREAALAPTSDVAKEVLNVVLRVLTIGSRGHFVAGSLGDKTSMERAMACAKRYGPATTFLTVSPDDVNNPTSLRLCCGNTDNLTFPAVATDEFFHKLRAGCDRIDRGTVRVPLGYTKRVQAATGNPVAVAREFRSMVENVMQVLIGCPLNFQPGTNSKQVRTWYFENKEKSCPRKKGVFGNITGYFGCIETQDRGALHFHVLLWGGISPRLLEMSTPFPDVCKVVADALDKMYTAGVPRGVHVRDILTRQMKTTEDGRSLLPPLATTYSATRTVPCPRNNKEIWQDFMYHNMMRTGVHTHSFSCKKPPAGAHKCRNGYCCACNGSTSPIFLKLSQSDVEKVVMKEMAITEVMPVIDEEKGSIPAHDSLRDYNTLPIVPFDDRLVVWELKRDRVVNLTALPTRFAEAYDRVKSGRCRAADFSDSDEEGTDVGKTLNEAKIFVIKEIRGCLEDDAVVPGNWVSENSQAAPCILSWLEKKDGPTCIWIYKELLVKLPVRNGMVVATNSIVCNATGSSSNAVLLGNTLQSTCALFYVVPYVCKNKVALDACLIALESAQKHIAAYPSIAADSGSVNRCVQHMFTRVLNNLSRSVQVSDTQVALSLLNMGMEIGSESYRYFGASNSVGFFLDRVQSYNECWEETRRKEAGERASRAKTRDSQNGAGMETISTIEHTKKPDGKYGTAVLYKVKFSETSGSEKQAAKSVPVYYPMHWWYRGEDLKNLTNMEYYALVDIKPKSSVVVVDDRPVETGRKKSTLYRFHPNHPLYDSHVQYLRSKQPTLIYNAFPPREPGDKPELPDGSTCPFELEIHEEDCKIWRQKANEFADFYSIVFLPQSDIFGDDLREDFNIPRLGWDAFCSRIKDMEEANTLINRLRIGAMRTFMHSLPSNYQSRTLLNNFRFRSTTIWSDEERLKATEMYGLMRRNGYYDSVDESVGMDNDIPRTEIFGSGKIKTAHRTLQFSDDQISTIRYLFQAPKRGAEGPLRGAEADAAAEDEASDTKNSKDILWYENDDGDAINGRAKAILDWKSPIAKTKSTSSGGTSNAKGRNFKRKRDGSFLDQSENVEEYIQTREFKIGQLRIVRKFATYFLALHKMKTQFYDALDFQVFYEQLKPPRVLLTGDPGTGKSYVIESITHLSHLLGLGNVATSSYNGIAAVNIDGSTVCSIFKIHESGTNCSPHLDGDNFKEMRERLHGSELCCVVIDEVSTIDSKVLALLSYRLQQLTGNTEIPFGGIPILLVGDFNQLGPVMKTFLPIDMMNWATRVRRQKSRPYVGDIPTPPVPISEGRPKMYVGQKKHTIGVSFSGDSTAKQDRKKEEEKAQRFKPDSLAYYGCSLFGSFRRFHLHEQNRASQDPNHTDFVQRLSSGTPIDLVDILGYKHLTRQDIADDPGWNFAPVLVSTNLERLNITREKSRLWAVKNCTFVFKWKTVTSQHVNMPPPNEVDAIREENALFWQFWVSGAPANIRNNINPELALVNGSPVTAHSLTFVNQDEHRRLLDYLDGPLAPPYGTEIEIEAPLSANMAIQPTLDGKPMTKKRSEQLEQLRKLSIVPCTDESSPIVIPITKLMTKGGQTGSDNRFVYKTYFPLVPIATVVSRPVFPFDLSFAITVHKAQGRTLEKMVVDMTDHPTHYTRMKFAAVFVALSRVRCGNDIRILRHAARGKSFCKFDAYSYLTKLVPCKYCMAFYHGYVKPDDWETEGMMWDMERACSFTSAL